MNVPPNQKICPQCGRRWLLSAPVCANCGHQFRTWFPGMPSGGSASGAATANAQTFSARGPDPIPTIQFHDAAVCPTARPHGGAHVIAVILLMILFPFAGFAQMYNGQFQKAGFIAFFNITAGLVIAGAIFIGGISASSVDAIASWANWFVFLVVGAIGANALFLADAIHIAVHITRGEPVGEWQWL